MKYVFAGHGQFIESVESRLADAGFRRAASASDADAVLTYCASQTALEDAYFDTAGFIQAAKPGTVLVDLSASTPNFARELNAVAAVNDLVFVEAPLVVEDAMRADAFADKDNLRCYVATGDGAAPGVNDMLNALVGTVCQTGGTGSAQLARAAQTLRICARAVAAIEADALYRAVRRSMPGGFSADETVSFAEEGPEASLLNAVGIGAFAGTYTVEMLMAELSAALMTADDVDLILPQAEAAMHLLELLAVIGGAEKAPSALALVYGEEADCAAQGLDWTRAEHAFDDECGCGCGHDHDHDDFGDYDDFDAFDYRDN
ncbi:MAG: NAD(P)-dependent oxidoreductase [Eggerthellaceae bacterium]|nr:NAD(P)-dependent oxidoreductase [Eggerthellaceae bacterium]